MEIIKKAPIASGAIALGTGLIGSGLYNYYSKNKSKGKPLLDDRDQKYLGFAKKVATTGIKGIPLALSARYGQAFLKDKLARNRMRIHNRAAKKMTKGLLKSDQLKAVQSVINEKGALGLMKQDKNFLTSVADPNGGITRALKSTPGRIALGASTVGLGTGLYGYQKAKDYYLV